MDIVVWSLTTFVGHTYRLERSNILYLSLEKCVNFGPLLPTLSSFCQASSCLNVANQILNIVSWSESVRFVCFLLLFDERGKVWKLKIQKWKHTKLQLIMSSFNFARKNDKFSENVLLCYWSFFVLTEIEPNANVVTF